MERERMPVDAAREKFVCDRLRRATSRLDCPGESKLCPAWTLPCSAYANCMAGPPLATGASTTSQAASGALVATSVHWHYWKRLRASTAVDGVSSAANKPCPFQALLGNVIVPWTSSTTTESLCLPQLLRLAVPEHLTCLHVATLPPKAQSLHGRTAKGAHVSHTRGPEDMVRSGPMLCHVAVTMGPLARVLGPLL